MAKTKADLIAENEALRNDLSIIAERIRTEAINRSWCSDYDSVMSAINEHTSEPHMQPCLTTHTVQAMGTITLSFSDVNVEVESSGAEPDGDEIEEAVRDFLQNDIGLNSSLHYVIDGVREVVVTESAVQ